MMKLTCLSALFVCQKIRAPGGHKGVVSVAKELGTNAFFRLRIGVGRGRDLARYVLEAIPLKDMEVIAAALHAALPDIVLRQLLVPVDTE